MQLELELTEPPSVSHALWEQFDPAQRETLIARLALAIAKAVVSRATNRENDHE